MAKGVKLTKRSVEAIRPDPDRDVYAWDSELVGFGLRVKPSGVRSYLVKYRIAGDRARWYTLGRHGRLTPHEAREEARQILAAASRGEDPARRRQEARSALTLAEVAERYLEDHLRPKRKPRTVHEFERLLQRRILPRLGRRVAEEIDGADVSDLHRSLRATPTEANRSLSLVSTLLNYAERIGARTEKPNPCRHIERYREQKRERYLSAEELGRLGDAIARAEVEATEHPSALLALRLLLLTGCRRSEILNLRWDEVDFELASLNLSDSKTGPKRVPLGPPALELLRQAPRQEGNPYVCWGEREGAPFVGVDKPWYRLRREARLEDTRLHDLRHNFAAAGAIGGESILVLAKLLGHRETRTTERYSHLSADPVRAAADRISAQIEAALRGEGGGAVVTFPSRGGAPRSQ